MLYHNGWYAMFNYKFCHSVLTILGYIFFDLYILFFKLFSSINSHHSLQSEHLP